MSLLASLILAAAVASAPAAAVNTQISGTEAPPSAAAQALFMNSPVAQAQKTIEAEEAAPPSPGLSPPTPPATSLPAPALTADQVIELLYSQEEKATMKALKQSSTPTVGVNQDAPTSRQAAQINRTGTARTPPSSSPH